MNTSNIALSSLINVIIITSRLPLPHLMGGLCSCSAGVPSFSRPKSLHKQSDPDFLRSPSAISICDAEDGSSDRDSLSSCMMDETDSFQNAQISSLIALHQELLPFFEVWDKLQDLKMNQYLSFCSMFYLNLSSDFINDSAEAFFDSSDPSKSGDFILRQINSTTIKIKDIYKLLLDPDGKHVIARSVELMKRQQTFTSRSPSVRYEVSQTQEIEAHHKNEAIKKMDAFKSYYRLHIELGIQDSMFDETYNALKKTFDDISESAKSDDGVPLEPLTHRQRGAIHLFFEIVRALMLQHDLSEVQEIIHWDGEGGGDQMESLMTNTNSKSNVKRFLHFWDKHFIEKMDETKRQLFSLRIYSFMVQRLQDRATGKYRSASNTPSISGSIDAASQIMLESLVHGPRSANNSHSLNSSFQGSGNESFNGSLVASSMNLSMNGTFLTVPSRGDSQLSAPLCDEDIMMMFHRNEPFFTSFSIGIVSWLNFLISFLRANEPKRLFVELKNTKRTYKRLGVDIQILNPLLFAFKSSCFVDECFYKQSARTFHHSQICVIDDELEESIDFVFRLFLHELTGESSKDFTSVDQASTIKGSPRSSSMLSHDGYRISTDIMSDHNRGSVQFHSPAINSPKKRLRQNVYSSLIFWKSTIQIESEAMKQKLSDTIYEMIARSASLHQRDFIHSMMSRMECNVNVIEVIDHLLRKIEAHSRDIKAPKRFAFMMGEDPQQNSASTTDEIDTVTGSGSGSGSNKQTTDTSIASTPSKSSNNRSRSVHSRSPEMKQSIKKKGSRRHSAETASSKNLVVDFVSLQHDPEIQRLIEEVIKKYSVSPMILKLFRTAIVNVLSKYYPHSFNQVTKRNFTILLRTVTALVMDA